LTELAAMFAFAGNAFLTPEPALLAGLARDLDEGALAKAVEDDAAALEIEYNRLFLNPMGAPCPPWQSVHTDEARLMGATHLQALDWYRRYDVEPRAANEPADHIGLLLLFYSRLVAAEAAEPELREFAAAHLAWIPKFCDSVESQSKLPFYRMVARLTREIIVF
jgi:TorA maturation chaperone TorD